MIKGMYTTVCARCSGFYAGALFTLPFYWVYLFIFGHVRPKKYLLFLLFPFIIQIIMKFLSLEFNKLHRFTSGFLLGVFFIILLLDGVSGLLKVKEQ